MAFVVKEPEGADDYEPAPAGIWPAVCVDVVDLGLVKGFYAGKETIKHKVLLVWQITETNERGYRYAVSKRYTASLHPKATLTADLESWMGRSLTDEEKAGFDLELLVGWNCQLQVIRKAGQGKDGKARTWVNIRAVVPVAKGQPKLAPLGYTRRADRKDKTDFPFGANAPAGGDIKDDDIDEHNRSLEE